MVEAIVWSELWVDDFSSQNPRWHWEYHAGTGYHVAPVVEESLNCLEHGITHLSSHSTYSDSSLHVLDGFTLEPTDIRLLRGRMKYNFGASATDGKGSMGFGIYNGYTNDIAWFWWASQESDAIYRGFRAGVVSNGVILLNQPISIDLTQFRIYEIRFLTGRIEFYIDDQIVAAVNNRPAGSMIQLEQWIDNAIYMSGGAVGYLDVPFDQKCFVDWIEYYQGAPGFNLAVNSQPISNIPVNIDGALAGKTPVATPLVEGQHLIEVPDAIEMGLPRW